MAKAKRKAAAPRRKSRAAKKATTKSRSRQTAKKAGGKRRSARKAAGSRAKPRRTASRILRKSARKAPRKAARTSSRVAAARKATRPVKAAKATAKRLTKATTKRVVKAPKKPLRQVPALVAAKAATPRPPASRRRPEPAHVKPASLERARRRLPEAEDITLPTPPSSLDLDRTASAARSGQAEIAEALAEHTETGPEITAGDVDASWESAYSTGDEAPGGDNPTPDQDVVDEIGQSLGLVYEESEELQGANKITERDKHRWELDPASSEDFDER